MKDYASMSDFEISRLVGDVLGVQWANLDENYHELCYWPELDDELRIFDPCNNPADAWPIITSKKICIAFDVFAEPNDGGGWVACPAYYIEGERIRHDNPLRAAMIVFLMMKEGEQ